MLLRKNKESMTDGLTTLANSSKSFKQMTIKSIAASPKVRHRSQNNTA